MEPLSDSIAARYDEILYPGQTRSSAHPERMATIATLFGLTPRALDGCRVLELGCGSGENLMSIALGLPGSECAGIDIAARPIAIGNQMLATLGLTNLRLEQIDVMDLPEDFGEFDYIIAHGLFSWVPSEVRMGVLELIRDHLSPQGIAFVSYNTYPGWHMAMAAREVMRYHSRHFTDPLKQIEQARGILDFVAKSTIETAAAYRAGILDAQKKVKGISDGGLYHDDLSATNTPFYFHEFASLASEHALQFLGEADFIEMQDHLFPPDVVATLRKLAGDDVLVREQFLDFLKGRKFRQSLLVHRDIAIDRNITPSRLTGMTISSNCRPLPADPERPGTSLFELPSGTSFSTDHPAAAGVLAALYRHAPAPISFDELHAEVWSESGREELDATAIEQAKSQLADILLWTYTYSLIDLHSYMPRICTTAGKRPVASPLARIQSTLKSGITNLLHQRVLIDGGLGVTLLHLLDGTRDRAALLAELQSMPGSDRPATSTGQLRQEIDDALDLLARHALLIG